jgi:hypothetical protein
MKPSAQNSNSPAQKTETPVFFVDRSLDGKIVPTKLREAGWKVEHHDDHFSDNTPDTTWISEAGRHGWIILTADERIRYKPAEKAALLDSGTLTFLLASRKGLTGVEMADAFLSVEVSIINAIAKQRPPAIFKVYAVERRVELWVEGDF